MTMKKGMKEAHTRPHGHWSIEEGKNVKAFFEDFARHHNFDPLTAQNWYQFKFKDIIEHEVYPVGKVVFNFTYSI